MRDPFQVDGLERFRRCRFAVQSGHDLTDCAHVARLGRDQERLHQSLSVRSQSLSSLLSELTPEHNQQVDFGLGSLAPAAGITTAPGLKLRHNSLRSPAPEAEQAIASD